ncbi:MAG: hypothetical protein JO151_06745 [Verrucomicrobia bacterium]|nr:hypothetical protein [Verrucomicrobiota bacterium]
MLLKWILGNADSRPVGEIPGAIEKTEEQPAKSEEVALKGADGATPQEYDTTWKIPEAKL